MIGFDSLLLIKLEQEHIFCVSDSKYNSIRINIIRLSLTPVDKKHYFVHLSFSSTLELIHDILSDLQKLLKCFNGTGIVAYFRIPLAAFGAGLATVVPNSFALFLKDLKLSSLAIPALNVFALTLEQNYKFPIVSG